MFGFGFWFVSFLLSECQTLEQVAQRGFSIFILGYNQNPTGHACEQPALAYPAFSNGVELNDLQRCLPASARTTQIPVILGYQLVVKAYVLVLVWFFLIDDTQIIQFPWMCCPTKQVVFYNCT